MKATAFERGEDAVAVATIFRTVEDVYPGDTVYVAGRLTVY